MLVPYWCDYYSFVVYFVIWKCNASGLFFFLKIALATWGLCGCIEIQDYFFYLFKKKQPLKF